LKPEGVERLAVILENFRGDSAAASLKRVHFVGSMLMLAHFRGDSAAASLKQLRTDGGTGCKADFRGDSAAASLKQRGHRRLHCGQLGISAAIPPRPH